MSLLLEPKLGIKTPYVLKSDIAFETKTVRFDNIDFHTVRFPSSTSHTKGKILLLHGWCEHTEMYQRIMEFLSSLEYESMVFDQRGSGRTSLGKYRGRCGRTADAVYRDVDKMIEVLMNSSDNNEPLNKNHLPLYLLGHLAGGGIALNYMLFGKYKTELEGVITTGPMIKVAEKLAPPPYIEYLLGIIASWFPYLPWGSINRDPNIKTTITSAEEWVEYIQNELLTQGNCTIGQIKFMFDRGHKLSNLNEKDMELNPNLKLLVIHCKDDPMTSFKYLKQFFDKVPLTNKKFVDFEKASHSLFIETEEIFKETCEEIKEFLS